MGNLELILEKHTERIHHGLEVLPTLRYGVPEGLGNKRWTGELILATYEQAQGSARQSTACSRSEEHTSELQSRQYLVCRLLLEKKKKKINDIDKKIHNR